MIFVLIRKFRKNKNNRDSTKVLYINNNYMYVYINNIN